MELPSSRSSRIGIASPGELGVGELDDDVVNGTDGPASSDSI